MCYSVIDRVPPLIISNYDGKISLQGKMGVPLLPKIVIVVNVLLLLDAVCYIEHIPYCLQ